MTTASKDLDPRGRGVLVATLAELLGTSEGKTVLHELDSHQRTILVAALKAHMAKLNSRSENINRSPYVHEATRVLHQEIIHAELQAAHTMIEAVEQIGR